MGALVHRWQRRPRCTLMQGTAVHRCGSARVSTRAAVHRCGIARVSTRASVRVGVRGRGASFRRCRGYYKGKCKGRCKGLRCISVTLQEAAGHRSRGARDQDVQAVVQGPAVHLYGSANTHGTQGRECKRPRCTGGSSAGDAQAAVQGALLGSGWG